MNELYIIKQVEQYNKYGEKLPTSDWIVTYYNQHIEHYPRSVRSSSGITNYDNSFESITNVEVCWIESCHCNVDIDIREGYYAYLANKFWKIVNATVYENCGCDTIKLLLERIVPRETLKPLVNCVNCFDTVGYLQRCESNDNS